MKMILIAAIALLVLGGGGAGAYFYFLQPAEAAAGAEVGELHEEEKHAKKDDHGDDHGGHGEFVEMDPLILPIVDNNGVSQIINVVIAIEVIDAKGVEKVEKMKPRLKDAYIQDMYGVLNKHAALKGGVLQVSFIKKRLNKISMKVLGEDVFSDVLLQVVQQRPI